MQDGKYFSPDCWRFVVKNGNVYFWDGEVMPVAEIGAIRCLGDDFDEDFSEWSDEERASVKQAVMNERKAIGERREKRERERQQEYDAVVPKVKAVLTDDEMRIFVRYCQEDM